MDDTTRQNYTGEGGLAKATLTLPEQNNTENTKYGIISGSNSYRHTWVLLKNKYGIHARPSAKIVELAKQYAQCEIWAEKGSVKIDAKDIMAWMTLGVPFGSEVRLIAKGKGCVEVLEKMVVLFDSKFNEE